MVKNEDTRTKLLRRCDTKLCGWEGRREREEGHTRRERRQKVGGGEPSCKARRISPKQVKGATVSYMKGSLRSRLLSCGTAGCPPTHHPGRPQILAPRPSAWRVRGGFARRGAPVRSAGTNEGRRWNPYRGWPQPSDPPDRENCTPAAGGAKPARAAVTARNPEKRPLLAQACTFYTSFSSLRNAQLTAS